MQSLSCDWLLSVRKKKNPPLNPVKTRKRREFNPHPSVTMSSGARSSPLVPSLPHGPVTYTEQSLNQILVDVITKVDTLISVHDLPQAVLLLSPATASTPLKGAPCRFRARLWSIAQGTPVVVAVKREDGRRKGVGGGDGQFYLAKRAGSGGRNAKGLPGRRMG